MRVRALIGTRKGAFLATSDAAREGWSLEGPLFRGWEVTAAHRLDDGDFLVGTTSFVYGTALHRGPALDDLEQVVEGPAHPEGGDRSLSQIWTLASGHGSVWCGVADAGLFRSEDGGRRWRPVEGLNEHPTREGWFPGAGGLCAHTVLLDPDDPDRIWCGISAVGVFRSDDGGRSWTPRNRGVERVVPDESHDEIGFCVHGLVSDPAEPDRIWQQNHRGMYRTGDGGDRWDEIQDGLPSTFGFPIERDHRTGRLFSVPLESDEYRIPPGAALRVYVSDDEGESWTPRGSGLPAEHHYRGVLRGAMALDRLDPCGVYLGTTGGTVHLSRDRGETWTTLPCSLPRIHCVEVFVDE